MDLTNEETSVIYKSLFLKETVLRILMDEAQNHMDEIKTLRKKFGRELSNDKEKE